MYGNFFPNLSSIIKKTKNKDKQQTANKNKQKLKIFFTYGFAVSTANYWFKMELSENDDATTLDTFPVISGVLRERSLFRAGEGGMIF